MIKLVPCELDIMKLLWNEGGALSQDEIIQRLPNRFRRVKKTRMLLDSLLEKGAVKIRADGAF